MKDIAIHIENLGKQYRLGEVGTGTMAHDLNRWWYKIRGKEDPYTMVGDVNVRTEGANSEYVWALKDIDLNVERGEVLGIIGKNGAGKSTLLKILSRVTGPSIGKITMKGRVASLLEVGTGFHPELTGRENIYLNGAILGMSRTEINKKIDEIIDFAGVVRYIDTPVKRYSSGMRVRLGFAVAAFLEPEILIIDEVLAVGDAEFQKKAVGKMQDVSKGGGRTVLFVSHNMTSVKTLCTRAILLEDGMIVDNGNTTDVVRNYLGLSGEEHFEISHMDESMLDKIAYGAIKKPSFIDLKSLYISDTENNVKSNFLSNQEILIHSEFEILRTPGRGFFMVISVLDHEKNKVITTQLMDADKAYAKIDPGTYHITCRLPKNIFASNSYQLQFEFIDLKAEHYKIDTGIGFNVQYFNERYTLGSYETSFLRPVFEWSKVRI